MNKNPIVGFLSDNMYIGSNSCFNYINPHNSRLDFHIFEDTVCSERRDINARVHTEPPFRDITYDFLMPDYQKSSYPKLWALCTEAKVTRMEKWRESSSIIPSLSAVPKLKATDI